MIVYIIATMISVGLAYLSSKINNKKIKIAVEILSALPLFIVAAIRYNVGTDYSHTYTDRFIWRATNGHDLSAVFEPGFIKIIDFILLFSKNPQWLFVICAFLFSAFTFTAIYQQSENPTYSVLLLVIGCHYFVSLNLMRCFVAIAIAIYAFKYIKERKIIPFTIFIALAATLHTSILILYPLYFLYDKRQCGVKTVTIMILCLIISLPLLKSLLYHVIQFTSYAFYYESEQYGEEVFLKTLFVVNAIILILFLKNQKEHKEDKLYNFYVKVELITFLITIMGGIMPMARRLILSFQFIQILSIPYIMKKEKNPNVRLVLNVLVIILLTVYTYREIVIKGYHEVLPYQTIFNMQL